MKVLDASFQFVQDDNRLYTVANMPIHELPSRTLAEAVTNRLRDEILSGALPPGKALGQEQLAEQFSVSRVPVREALRALAAEGLVTLQSHHSALVTSLTPDQVEELVFIAGALDAAAAARAASRLTEGDLSHMEGCLAEMDKVQAQPKAWLALNLEFHLIPIRSAGWTRLESLIVDSRRNIGRYVYPVYDQCMASWDVQHHEIYEACKARDESRLKRNVEQHWKYTVDSIRRTTEAGPRRLSAVGEN